MNLKKVYILPVFIALFIDCKQTSEPDEKPLSVTQYHFTSWPDHGVPKFATSLISFIRRVQKAHDKDKGIPLLVHCSAGVGRTGTFILLDSMLERIKAEKTVNVYEFLMGLRQKRVLMVQTLVQYNTTYMICVHVVLLMTSCYRHSMCLFMMLFVRLFSVEIQRY